MTDGQHLHLDDYPETLRLLSALVGVRADKERPGYSATEHGAVVDWEPMIAGPLSSTEVAIVHIARLRHPGPRRGCPAASRRRRR